MKTIRHRRLAVCALALGIATLTHPPVILAQAPAPAAPVTAGDAKEYQAIADLAAQEKWGEVMKAGERFLEKYKELSPRSLEVHYLLGLAYLHQDKMQDDAVRELKKVMDSKNVSPEAKEQAQLLIAKAYTMKGFSFPEGTDAQTKLRNDVYLQAIDAYDKFLAAYPKSRSGDSAYFLSGVLALEVKRFDDAVKRFGAVFQNYPQSPLRNDALLNVGKTFLIKANDLLTPPPGKEPKPEDVQSAMDIYEKNALPALTAVFQNSSDLAILNEAQFYIGQIRLTQSQRVTEADEKAKKQKQAAFLNPALDAFRAVRSIEEVVGAEEAKIKGLQDAISRLDPRDAKNYLPYRNYYENLINLERDKLEKLKSGSDQYLAARVAIARIFLFLEKYDECRALLKYLQGQKELFAKDKNSEAAVAALLCQTYVGQNNLEKALETYDAFRAAFKGNDEGEALPLFVANLAVEKDNAPKAEEVVNQGVEDYKDAHKGTGWSFANDAVRVLIRVALQKQDFQKALDLCEKVLSGNPKPDVEVETLYIKGSIQEQMGIEKQLPGSMDEAMKTYQVIRDKFSTSPKAEDAWARQCQILAGKADADGQAKAVAELTKFIDTFKGGSGKSPDAVKNVTVCQYLLGKVLKAKGDVEGSVKAFRKLIDDYADAEVTPDAFFRIFEIENERKDYPAAAKAMEEFIQKYPEHKNLYYAYGNLAEFLDKGLLRAKKGPDGKPLPVTPTEADHEAAAKKLFDYVDYELSKKLQPPRGESALLKAADYWLKPLSGFGNFELLTKEQKISWQKAVDGVLAAVEKHLQSYPAGEHLGEILERAVKAEGAMTKARQTTYQKGEAYFRDLISKYGSAPDLKAKILMALATYLGDSNQKLAAQVRKEAVDLVAQPVRRPATPDSDKVVIFPTFTPDEWDKVLEDNFNEKKYDEMGRLIERIRTEYPLGNTGTSIAPAYLIDDAQAVGLFWEGKILVSKGDVAGGGAKFEELRAKYPRTTKKMEADYGVINGEYVSGKLKTGVDQRAAIKRLKEIIQVSIPGKGFDLQANALILIGHIYEDMKDYDSAITAYAKVADNFSSVPAAASEGLWRAASLLDKQANKQLDVLLPDEKAAAAKKAKDEDDADAKAKAAKEKKDAPPAKPGEKPAAKPGDKTGQPAAKPEDKKNAPAKPADKTTAAAPK